MSTQENFLAEEKVRLKQCDGNLWLVADGQKVALGNPRRALPLSHPDEYIVLTDQHGAELGIVQRVGAMESESRSLLRHALAAAYSIIEIIKIQSVERHPLTGQVQWTVEVAADTVVEDTVVADSAVADTGACEPALSEDPLQDTLPTQKPRFRLLKRGVEVRDEESPVTRVLEFTIGGTEDVQTARYPHIYIHDCEGRRYEIVNCENLDLESRRAAERYF